MDFTLFLPFEKMADKGRACSTPTSIPKFEIDDTFGTFKPKRSITHVDSVFILPTNDKLKGMSHKKTIFDIFPKKQDKL